METMYFVLGMLSIIAAAIVSIMVWGIVKINKQQQRIDYIQRLMEEAPRELHTRFAEIHREIDDRFNWAQRRIDECEAGLHRRIDGTNSYIDSRIGKAIGPGTKQLIKG